MHGQDRAATFSFPLPTATTEISTLEEKQASSGCENQQQKWIQALQNALKHHRPFMSSKKMN